MIAAIIQARMSSTRLPGKVMLDLAGEPLLYRVVERVRRAECSEVVVATSVDASDDPVAELCNERGIKLYRGALDDVLDRYARAAQAFSADTIIRITSDCPLIDPDIIDRCIEAYRGGHYDYVSSCRGNESTFPRGLDVEAFSRKALEKAASEAKEPYEREHVTPYIWENKKNIFSIGPVIEALQKYRRNYRLTVDYPEDYSLMQKIYQQFYRPGNIIHVPDVLSFLDTKPEWVALNANCTQKPVQ
ncbi:MAG: glycosyltransferase family protein [bacterium]|nr:glycosyltransferase family protein [bacterium]